MRLMGDKTPSSFLSPSRTRFEAIRTSLAGIDDPSDAWRALAERGVIPKTWLDDPQRRFIHDPGDRFPGGRSNGYPTRDPVFAPVVAFPSSVAECAQFAADLDGVLAAEAAARSLVERLGPWGAAQFSQVRWWTIPAVRYGRASDDTRPGVSYGLMFAFNALYDAKPERELPRGARPMLFGNASFWAGEWNEVAGAGTPIPKPHHRPIELAMTGRAFAELANPFEPLATIEAAGYATFEWIGATGDSSGAIVLVSPAVDQPVHR